MSFWVPPRLPSRELLDAGVPPAEAEVSLADMERAHRRLGGRRVVRQGLVPLLLSLDGRSATLLDVGCGSGHAGRDLVGALAREGKTVRVLGLDRQLAHAHLARHEGVLAGDATRLPLADRTVDIVLSTLFFHHFSEEELPDLLRESARVARRAVVAFDLARHRASLAAATLLGPLLFTSPISISDGRASVRQAYTPREMEAIAAPVLPGCEVTPAGPFVWRLLWRRP